MDFAALKKNSGKANIERLSSEVDKLNSRGEFPSDDRFWTPQRDKAGNGFAIFRFLPAGNGEEIPFIRRWDHGFKGPSGKWYIELSRTTLGPDERDPAGEYNTQLWNSSEDKESPARKQASRQKRRLHFISNIYVIKDSANPANDGKVFLYRYGKKIWDKINDAMNPPQDAAGKPMVEPMNPFDLWTGANFQLKIRTISEGENRFPNYDLSTFMSPGPLFPKDSDMEAVFNQCSGLKEFVDPKLFKSYDELKAKLNAVLETSGPSATAARRAVEEDLPWAKEAQPSHGKTAASRQETADGDEDLGYFARLASGE